MGSHEWRTEAARNSLGRLLPRLEKAHDKSLAAQMVQWRQFKNRLHRRWGKLFFHLHDLYGWQYDFFYTLERSITALGVDDL